MQNNELDPTAIKLGTWLRDTFGAPGRTSSGRIYSIEDMQRWIILHIVVFYKIAFIFFIVYISKHIRISY